jgi:hypothetical protein
MVIINNNNDDDFIDYICRIEIKIYINLNMPKGVLNCNVYGFYIIKQK